jgi:hypothetical protein
LEEVKVLNLLTGQEIRIAGERLVEVEDISTSDAQA